MVSCISSIINYFSHGGFLAEWEIVLNDWVSKAPRWERRPREEAAKRIKDCYSKSMASRRELDLSNLGLTSIDGLIFPPGLRLIRLNNNRITAITDCELDFQGAGLYIDLARNQITSIINVTFQRIWCLDLQHNQINEIEDVRFQTVHSIILSHNPLTDLPDSCAEVCEIVTEQCRIDQSAADRFRAVLASRRNERLSCPQWTNTMDEQDFSDSSSSSSEETITEDRDRRSVNEFLNDELNAAFSETEQASLHQFLNKLKETIDYKNSRMRRGIIFTVNEILIAASHSETFKTNLFWLINAALSSCVDGIAITLNRIEAQRRLDTTVMDIDLLIGYRRLQLVHEAAEKIIKEKMLGDAIEPMLYIQNQLKEQLKLPIATEDMRYPRMANVSNDELVNIGREIEDATSSFEEQLAFLTEPLLPIKMKPGRLVNLGTLSNINPFNFSIQELWEKYLQQKNADLYRQIEERFSEDDLINPIKIQEWEDEKKQLNIALTKEILAERHAAKGATNMSP